MAQILIVDDEKNYRIVLARLITTAGHQTLVADNPFAALELLSREEVSLVVSDLRMPHMDGMEFFRAVREQYPELPFVILTAFATVESAIQAMKDGAFDYLTKPFKNDEILVVIDKALEYVRLRQENDLLRRQLNAGSGQELLGQSPAIKRLLEDIARVAPVSTSVLVTGESGTGKELVVRALHRQSPRHGRSLVCVNCATFSRQLLESELFGHERGAFTGATERKHGLLEAADGGTLFLDEIGELPLELQPKLLRLLQEKSFRRVGGAVEIGCDVRIVAATNRNLPELIENGQFREDLYYRLNVVNLYIPPLRERIEDIGLLAFHFLQVHARRLGRPVEQFAADTLALLQAYPWPGNVRELRNIIERSVLFSQGRDLQPGDLPESLQAEGEQPSASVVSLTESGKPLPQQLEEIESDLIHQAMVQARGVQARAARLLGISRSNLQYKLRKFGQLGD